MKIGIFRVLLAGVILIGFTSKVKAKAGSNNPLSATSIIDTAKMKKQNQ